MNDTRLPDRLSAALRGLETHRASDGFTDGVLGRLEARDGLRRRRRATRIALAVGAAAVVAVFGVLLALRPAAMPPDGDSTARAEEIRRQYRAIQEELERLQQASDREPNVLYLGASDEYDLVLDLDPLLDQRIGAPAVPAIEDLRARPALARDPERRQP